MLVAAACAAFCGAVSCGGEETACPRCDGPPTLSTGTGGAGGIQGTGGESHQGIAPVEDTAEGRYCERMVSVCHDDFHAEWGADHLVSINACLAHAKQMSHAGEEVTEGDFFECRDHWSKLARANASLCPRAMGVEVCI